MVRFLIASLLFLATALPAAADFETGLEAFRNGDYKTVFTLWEPLAKAGAPEAQFSLGILYRRGLGVEPDYRQAMGWFERAAGRGHPSTQFNLGYIYEKGIGVRRSRVAALRWYRRAAKADETVEKFRLARARAQFRLAGLLRLGSDVDWAASMHWMQQSAKNGYQEAQFQLGLGYAAGKQLPRDPVRAAKWFERAASQGHTASQVNLGSLLESGSGVERDEARATEWCRKAAEQDLAVAQGNLGSLYAKGRGVARDDRAALEWYRRAAQSNAMEAHYNLGVLYENSPELADDREAYFWYAVASKAGHRKAALRLVKLREKIGEAEAAAIEKRAAAWRPGGSEEKRKPAGTN